MATTGIYIGPLDYLVENVLVSGLCCECSERGWGQMHALQAMRLSAVIYSKVNSQAVKAREDPNQKCVQSRQTKPLRPNAKSTIWNQARSQNKSSQNTRKVQESRGKAAGMLAHRNAWQHRSANKIQVRVIRAWQTITVGENNRESEVRKDTRGKDYKVKPGNTNRRRNKHKLKAKTHNAWNQAT